MQARDTSTVTNATEEQSKDRIPVPGSGLPRSAGYRMLVVDDNMINCQVAVHVFAKLGCDADAATSSVSAIDMHKRQRYDLILMDCQMPELDGYQATAQIRRAELGGRRTAIIGWTSTLEANQREKCMAAGMDDMIPKPIRPEMAQQMITRWIPLASTLSPPIADELEVDLANTQQMFGVNFAGLAALFQKDTPERIAAMQKLESEGNISQIAAIAHVLGGSCASMGAMHMANTCRELEICCKAIDTASVHLLLDKVHAEYATTESRIIQMLQSSRP